MIYICFSNIQQSSTERSMQMYLLPKPQKITTDVNQWLEKFSKKWLEKNKPSELFRIQEMSTVLNEAWRGESI